MKPVNLEKVNHSFAIQAQNFESKDVNFTREDYLDYTISCIGPKAQDIVLEAAAGTCVCGRSFAPLVKQLYAWMQRFPCWKSAGKKRAAVIWRI